MNQKNWLIIGVIVLIAVGIYFYNSDGVGLNPETFDSESRESACEFEKLWCEWDADHERDGCLGGEGFQELYDLWCGTKPKLYLLFSKEASDRDIYVEQLAKYNGCLNFIDGRVNSYCRGKHNDAMDLCDERYTSCMNRISINEKAIK